MKLHDDLNFSPVVAGMMNLSSWGMSADALANWLQQAISLGITTFDHADTYGGYTCEALFGAALAQKPGLRNLMQVVTKCDIMLISDNRPQNTIKHYDTSRAHIIASAERSLKNLRTDVIDLFLIHRPDPLMDADEVAAALLALHTTGKVRDFGVSNFTPGQFALLQSRLDFPLVTNQVECSVMHMAPLHDGTFDQCQQQRITPMVWSPLAGGSIFRGDDDRAARVGAALQQVAEAHPGAGLDQIALAWIMRHPTQPLPVLGTGKLERLADALAAIHISLSRQEWFHIWQASAGHEVP